MNSFFRIVSSCCVLFFLAGCSSVAHGLHGIADGVDEMGQEYAHGMPMGYRNGKDRPYRDLMTRRGHQEPYAPLAAAMDRTAGSQEYLPGSLTGYYSSDENPYFSPASSSMPITPTDSSVSVFGLDAAYPQPAMAAPGGVPHPYQNYPVIPGAGAVAPMGAPAGAGQVFFRHDSTLLNGADRRTIKNVAQGHNPAMVLNVEGHASNRAAASSSVERKITNLKVSMDRAFNVSRQLIRGGVPAEAIRTTAWGEMRPTPMGEEKTNRRVDMYPSMQ